MCIGFSQIVKKQGGQDDFLFFLQDVCILLLQNAPRLARNPSRVAIDDIARLTGSNHWPVKRETPEEGKAMKAKTKRFRVCLAKGRPMRSGKHIKTTQVCKGCPWKPGLCVEKECFELYHTQFDFRVYH